MRRRISIGRVRPSVCRSVRPHLFSDAYKAHLVPCIRPCFFLVTILKRVKALEKKEERKTPKKRGKASEENERALFTFVYTARYIHWRGGARSWADRKKRATAQLEDGTMVQSSQILRLLIIRFHMSSGGSK